MQNKYINKELDIDTKNYLKKGFTFVEIIVATFISVLIMTFIFIFLINTIETIGTAKKNVSMSASFYDFSNKFYNYRNIYLTGGILVDNPTATGSDVFLMEDYNGQNAMLVGPVDIDNGRLLMNNTIYENKGVGFRRLSYLELIAIDANIDFIYDLYFEDDQIFSELKIHDFSLSSYNSGSIYELSLIVESNFQITYINQLLKNYSKESQKTFNINF